MKLIYARLKNYIGIYQGLGKNEIEINFGNNRITMIRGRNGSGKTTLRSALHAGVDSNSCFMPGLEGEKELHYLNRGMIIKVNIIHPVSKNGDRAQTKAYIKKEGPNGYAELNPNGNITSYYDILYTEFKLDPNFIALAAISAEDKGIVEKTPSNRKKFVNAITSETEVYNNMNKVLTKRSSVYKSMMVNLTSKISTIGEPEKLNQRARAIETRIMQINQNIEICVNTIADAKARVSLLDPDGAIQSVFNSAQIDLEKLSVDEDEVNEKISYILKSNMLGLESVQDLSRQVCADLYQSAKNEVYDLSAKSSSAKQSLEGMLRDRETEHQALVKLQNQIDSLKSEYDFQSLQRTIEVYEENIAKYEAFFDSIHLKKGTTLSKDEYIIGLNTLQSIESMVEGFKSYTTTGSIILAIDSIIENKNLISDSAKIEEDIKKIRSILDQKTSEYSFTNGLLLRSKILSKRPSDCKNDMCPFIVDAVEASKNNPEETIDQLSLEIEALKEELKSLESKNEIIRNAISCARDIQTVLRNVQSNASIIKKLPVRSSILNRNEFLTMIKNGERFNEINELYTFIDYANIFEEYKTAKDILYKAKTDYSIYENKNKTIDQYVEMANGMMQKVKSLADQIGQLNMAIREWDKKILESEDYFKTLTVLTKLFTQREEIISEKSDCIHKINAASSNMESIQIQLAIIHDKTDQMKYEKSELDPLSAELDKIRYSLQMLEEYTKEYNEFKASFDELEIYRTYTTPTKKGIQNLFIKVYMNQTRDMANQILAELFEGRLRLEEYVIDDDKFAIPCYSMNTGMITDDVSSCSRSEKSMISMIIGFVLLRQASTQYNILSLDEIDEGLDSKNRLMFMQVLNYLLDLLEVEQCIMISHTVEIDMSNVDVIQLLDDESNIGQQQGNVIFDAAA